MDNEVNKLSKDAEDELKNIFNEMFVDQLIQNNEELKKGVNENISKSLEKLSTAYKQFKETIDTLNNKIDDNINNNSDIKNKLINIDNTLINIDSKTFDIFPIDNQKEIMKNLKNISLKTDNVDYFLEDIKKLNELCIIKEQIEKSNFSLINILDKIKLNNRFIIYNIISNIILLLCIIYFFIFH